MENIEKNILQPHQEEAYENTLELLEDKGKAAVIFPTGCGKTFIALQYMIDHPDEKVLFLSPRHAINEQMYKYIIKFVGGDNREIEEIKEEFGTLKNAVNYYAPNFESMLYQSIIKLGESEIADEVIGKLKPNLIIADEIHHLEVHAESENQEVSENIWGQKFDEFLEMNAQAKILGLTATPVKMNGANIVERMFEDAVAEELSLLDAIEAGIIKSPEYVVPDFITEDEKQTLLEKIEIAQGQRKQELKERYDELVEQSDKAQGIPELMEEHVKEKDGRYIIFCKDIKDMEEKMVQSKEWFEKIDEEPEIYGVNYLNNNRENNKILDEFGNSKSEHIKLMYCVGMLDEGVHVSNISGVILTTKTESRPIYLQRLGRAISSGKDKKQTLVIDLVNNNEILQNPLMQNEKGYEITDAEALAQLIDWIEEKNNGEIPVYSEENSIKENLMAKRFIRLNNKYYKYAENDELYNELDEYKQEQVDEIFMLGEQIGLFDEFIEIDDKAVIEDINNVNKFMDNIEIKGFRKNFLEILKGETKESIMKWIRKEGRMPESFSKKENKTEEEKEERNVYVKWWKSEEKKTVDKYKGIELEEIENEEDRRLVEEIRSYGYGNELEVMQWIRKNGRIPGCLKEENLNGKERIERNIYEKWRISKEKKIADKYKGIELEEIENEEDRKLVEEIRGYGYGNELEVMQWIRKNGRIPRHCSGKNLTEEEKEERKVYYSWSKLEEKKIVDKYRGIELEKIVNEEDRNLVEEIRGYGYLGKALKTGNSLGKKVAQRISNKKIKVCANFLDEVIQLREEKQNGINYSE